MANKAINIQIDDLKLNTFDHLGSISFGSTKIIGRNVSGKKTQGFGQQMADYTTRAFNMHYVLDEDYLDNPSVKTNK